MTTSIFQTIANEILKQLPEECKTYQQDIEVQDYTFVVDVDYSFDVTESIGTTFESYDFERITDVENEAIEIKSVIAIDEMSNEIDIDTNEIQTLLN